MNVSYLIPDIADAPHYDAGAAENGAAQGGSKRGGNITMAKITDLTGFIYPSPAGIATCVGDLP